MSFYMGVKKALGGFLRTCFYRCKIEGEENIPESGRLLVCSNHISLHDPIVIAAISKRQICYMGKKELFKVPLFGSFLKSLGAFPVDRKSGGDVGAIRHSIKLLEKELNRYYTAMYIIFILDRRTDYDVFWCNSLQEQCRSYNFAS